MEREKVLECVRRYLNHIEEESANVGESYAMVDRWINENCEDKEFKGIIRLYVLHRTLQVINKSEINCKQSSQGNWSSEDVQTCYKKLDRLEKEFPDIFCGDLTFKRLLDDFSKFIEALAISKPWLYLYFCKVYADKEFGKWLLNNSNDEFKKVEELLNL